MSFVLSKQIKLSNTLKQGLQNEYYETDLPLMGGMLSNTRYLWQAKGPCLEVRDSKNGFKIGSWTFGCVLKDSNTKIICIEDLKKSNGGLYLLAVALECTISGGIICLFNVFSSTIVRAIHIKEKISGLHVVDTGVEVLNLPGPLRDFDGILAVGTEGGQVLLIDVCRQICEQTSKSATLKDELNPAQLLLITARKISRLEQYRERAIHDGDHLAIHLNVVFDSQTEHFTLKGPKGEDRIHVNRDEVATSALYYCPQLTSLLVGFNFGAFQLWDLTTLQLVYTSPVCDEHIPVTKFGLQEPTDDPRAFCYIWASYSYNGFFHTGLPFAVMYSFCYTSKEFHEGYGYLYQNFQSCSVRYQIELGPLDENRLGHLPKGGYCLGLQPICKLPSSKDSHICPTTGDTLALCIISWSVWYSEKEIHNYALVFDLNQWYKEQMPIFTKWGNCNSYILRMNFADHLPPSNMPASLVLDVKLDSLSLRQFVGIQRLEEHFYPASLSFTLLLLRENDVVCIHSEGLQKALLHQIQSAGPLCLVRPNETYHKIVSLGLAPLFVDIVGGIGNLTDLDFQREVILDVALEHHLISWLYACARDWANGRFSSAGCSLDFLLNWAFQRAVLLKTNCDKLCASLFDYSQSRLDHNTSIFLTSCTGQINILYKVFYYVLNNLVEYISYINVALEQKDSLEMVAMYFEVLQWLVNVGLLPECHPSSYPRPDVSEKISAPYPAQQLTEYYIERRAQLQLLSKDRFASRDSLLFIDNLINNKCGAELLQKQWQDDGGSGLYPPPSLQSLLRTYLVPGTNIFHKHSLVIYLFLDLAMALDQCQYSSIITYLIKFPAVFKVRPSIIKMTQAFWQLDHGDYNTALEQLLDPFVLNDDLQPWHHTIAMRSLLLQNQHNAALVYLQVRKPPITEDGDIFTALSLFITNKMLAEAFYFLKQHCHNNEEKYLLHLFNECNKNDLLHVLLYRCLNSSEEKAFLHYLSKVQNPTSKDLQVFYFLLRSRFVEAFEVHANLRKKKPESQGLIGQKTATQTDQVVKIFKSLLPDVNRNLVDYIRKERNSLWTEVPRPTPLSVFVHNTQEKVQYKSTIIHAAISKAKDTFMDTTNKKRVNDLLTEETPFLRTPTAFRNVKRHATPVITPKVIEFDENGDEVGPTPPKRYKMSPRAPMSSPTNKQSSSIHSKMLTPMVERRTSTEDYSISNVPNICTPQSILKVRNLVRYTDSVVPEDSLYEDDDRPKTSTRKSAFGLLPRKSLSRSTQHVQFEDITPLSSSVSDLNFRHNDNSTIDDRQKSLSSREISLMVSSKNSSTSVDDEFYTPETSNNENQEIVIDNNATVETNEKEKQINETVVQETVIPKNILVQQSQEEDIEFKKVVARPKARRSYKGSLEAVTPIRSSPRLSRKLSQPVGDALKKEGNKTAQELDVSKKEGNNIEQEFSPPENVSISSEASSNRSPRFLHQVRGRKSLTRKVLEHNTFSKLAGSIPSDLTVSKEIHLEQTEKTVISEKSPNTSKVSTVRSSLNISDISTTESDSLKKTPVSNKKHVSSCSFSKIETSKTPLYSDSSTLSEYSFSSEPDQVIPEITIPDSVIQYLNSLKANSDEAVVSEVVNEDQTLQNVTDVNSTKKSNVNKESPNSQQRNLNKEQSPDSDRHSPDSDRQSPFLDKELSSSDEKENQVETDRNIILCVYDDLSNDAENVEDILGPPEQKYEKLEESPLSEESEIHKSGSFYLPETEIAFIADPSETSDTSSKLDRSKNSSLPEAEVAFVADKSEISDDLLPTKEIDQSFIVISSEEESSDSDQSIQNEAISFDGEEDEDDEDDYFPRSQEHSYDSEESKSTVDLGNSRCSEDSSDVHKLQGNEHEMVNIHAKRNVMIEHSLVTEEVAVKFQSIDTELKLSGNKNAIIEDFMPGQPLDSQEIVFIEGDDEKPMILPDEPSQQSQKIEDKTFAELQTIPLQEETEEEKMTAVQGILHESPDYMEDIPLEDQELFEGTLVKEVSVSTTPETSNIVPPHVQPFVTEPGLVEQNVSSFDDKIAEDQNPDKKVEQLKDILSDNMDGEISLKLNQPTNATQQWTLIEQELEGTTNEDKEILSEKESIQDFVKKDHSAITTQASMSLEQEREERNNEDKEILSDKYSFQDFVKRDQSANTMQQSMIIEQEQKGTTNEDKEILSEKDSFQDFVKKDLLANTTQQEVLIEQELKGTTNEGKGIMSEKEAIQETFKKDQSTNTTKEWTLIELELEETTNEDKAVLSEKEAIQESLKKDQSTNTTHNFTLTSEDVTKNNEDPAINSFISTTTDNGDVNINSQPVKHLAVVENIVKSKSTKGEKLDDMTPKVKKSKKPIVYSSRNKKVTMEDSDSSSSGITEGEPLKEKIVVTAQIHNPSEIIVEDASAKKITRKQLQESTSEKAILSEEIKGHHSTKTKKESITIDLEMTSDTDHQLLPGIRTTRRSLSSSSAKVAKKQPVRTRRASHSETNQNKTIDCDLNSSKQIIENPVVVKLMRRTRSVSVDEPKTYTRKHSLRSGSVDKDSTFEESVDNKSTRSRSKALSVSNLPVINEESISRKLSGTSNVLADYASSRRLTRKQASMLKDIPTPSEVTAKDDSEIEESVDDDVFDPINLLDKEPFKGTPDPEEQKVYEESSPSTSTVSSFAKPTKRQTRSASVASDGSLSQSASKSSPKMKRGNASQKNSPPTTKGIKTRSRKHSETSSISEKSEPATPPKRSKRIQSDNETDSVVSRGSRRSRNSVESESPKSRKGSRRKIISKSELPEIKEEKIIEVTESKQTEAKKRTRKH